MRATDVMTTNVVTVQPGTPLIEAIRLMLKDAISGLPVVDHAGDLVGIVTEGDLLRRHETETERYNPRWTESFRLPGLAEQYARAHGRKVADVMTPTVVTVDEEAALSEVVDLMERRQINRVLVVRGGKLVGIVARSDLLRALARLIDRETPVEADDETIRAAIWAELSRQQWTPPGTVQIAVRGGVVDLRGAIPDERYRQALRIAAENAVGAKSVEDYLITASPDAFGSPLRRLPKFLPSGDGPGLNLQ